jgi:hypothetical protein
MTGADVLSVDASTAYPPNAKAVLLKRSRQETGGGIGMTGATARSVRRS